MLTKFHLVKAMVFLVVMYECESWTIKAAEYWTVDLEKTIDCPFDSKEIKPVNPKGNQPWIFIGRTYVEVDAPILWIPVEKSQFIGKDLMLGKVEGRRRNGWQRIRCLDLIPTHAYEFEQIPGDSEGQGSLGCCSPWGQKSWTWLSDCKVATIHYHLRLTLPILFLLSLLSKCL